VSGFSNAGENELTRRTGEQESRGERCAICESRREEATVEIFQFSDEVDTYIFKIDTAKKIVTDGRAALPVSPETLRAFAGMNEFDFDHLFHVDLSRPGIFTRRFGAPMLLDGTHRAVRCFAKQQQFRAFELSYEESVECLVQQRTSAKRCRRHCSQAAPGIGSFSVFRPSRYANRVHSRSAARSGKDAYRERTPALYSARCAGTGVGFCDAAAPARIPAKLG
jgi:hypothetical protein